jgi:2'-5' RNA ligase
LKNEYRIFLGIPIPERIKDTIISGVPIYGQGKGWIQKEDLHLTLRFIGHTSASDVILLQERLNRLNLKMFTLQLGDWGFFGKRIFHIAVRPCAELIKWRTEIYFAKKQESLSPDFFPHITLRRLHPDNFQSTLVCARKLPPLNLEFEAEGVSLFNSDPGSQGVKYRQLFFKEAHSPEHWPN